ncbi:hypothetical protein ABK040_012325 [Willaertia magna]
MLKQGLDKNLGTTNSFEENLDKNTDIGTTLEEKAGLFGNKESDNKDPISAVGEIHDDWGKTGLSKGGDIMGAADLTSDSVRDIDRTNTTESI